jgi:hypothetical protein
MAALRGDISFRYLKQFFLDVSETLPKTQSEIDISPFLKTQKPSSSLFFLEEGFCVFRNGLISISD